MRVALLSHNAQAGDAVGRQIAEKVAFFVNRGADVRVFVESTGHLHSGLAPFTYRFAPGVPRGPHWRFLLASDLVVVEYSQHYSLLDLLPLLVGGSPRIVFDYHGVTPPHLSAANHRDVVERGRRLRGLVWYADSALTHSRFAGDELLSATCFPRNLTQSLGYPIDTTAFAPSDEPDSLRQTLGLPAETRLLLFVGRMAPNKRVPLLVDALGHLRNETPSIHAVIVGDGSGAHEPERQRCRERASRLGVSDRLHFLGQVSESALSNAYRDADVFVMPSVHEGFCLPVIEAMACGCPVVAARAAALPETVSGGGLTFTADDPADLARQVRRVLREPARVAIPIAKKQLRIAVVAPRFGDGFVGGAETSLRTLANRKTAAGCAVEVFTTGTVESSTIIDGLPVHRFRADEGDPNRLAAAAHALCLPNGLENAEAADDFMQHSLWSSRLVASLCERGPFDAVVVGPYLHGLTCDVAQALGERVLLLPCFHDEPFARLPGIQQAFENIGGILYHSPEEQHFAEAVLGINHPNSCVLGAVLATDRPGDPLRGRAQIGTGRRYVLYAGRYCRDKGLPELLGYARRYAADYPERFTFAFAGEGDVAIPQDPWASDLGYVTEAIRRDALAGADAFVLLSPNESLSLATLEAQAQGLPVILCGDNPVLRGHIARGGGGVAVEGYEDFAAALDDLWSDPLHWRTMGRQGREYVGREFSDGAAYDTRWQAAIENLNVPIAEQMRQKGLRRASEFDRAAWREQFGKIIDQVCELPARTQNNALEIRPRTATLEASPQAGTLLIPVRLSNRGQLAEAAEGLARTELVAQVFNETGDPIGPETATQLPGLLLPRQDVAALVRAAVPTEVGEYQVALGFRRLRPDGVEPVISTERPESLPLRVVASTSSAHPLVESQFNLAPTLRFAQEAQQLPDGYVDVSTGRFARWKCWLKSKLLHNFQRAYVDVLSRQQSAFNRQVLNALTELGDGQAALAHGAAVNSSSPSLETELRRLRRQNRRLRMRLARIEATLAVESPHAQETSA